MKKRILLVLNTSTFLLVLIINYLSNTNLIGKLTVGGVSELYPNVITPAGYAFAIWGLIYLLLICFIAYQWYSLKKGNGDLIDSVGFYFAISNLANAFWVIVWVNKNIALSLFLIITLLFCLLKLMQKLNLEMWNAPRSVILFVWWPVTIYLGWIILATVLNFLVFLVSIGQADIFWGAVTWGAVLIVLSTFIYIYLICIRNLREAAMVGVWGFIAIAFKQADANPVIAIFAVSGAVILFIYTGYHAYKNRKENALFG